jgi:hypothetical protein
VERPAQVAPLHPPFAEDAHVVSAGSSLHVSRHPLTAVSAPAMGPADPAPNSYALPVKAFIFVLLAVGLLAAVVAAVPKRVLAAYAPLLHHRGDVALGGLTVLLSLGVGVLAAFVLG